MTHARINSRASAGIDAPSVTVEVHISNGLPGFAIVGLPESTVKEAKERVRSALLNSYLTWPDRRITVSLSPAELPKSGARFDLPIALAILAASGQLAADTMHDVECFGELGLDGRVRPCKGLLSAVLAGSRAHKRLIVPTQQRSLLALLPEAKIIGVEDLLTTCSVIKDPKLVPAQSGAKPKGSSASLRPVEHLNGPAIDLEQIAGQLMAKRALGVAAAGGHHLLMTGPPGAGKTLLASCLPQLLPPLADTEIIEIAIIRDLLGLPPAGERPFRSPHHSASPSGLIGGGVQALPGEISLAHRGVLFLDEIAEFPRRTLDLLRQPLENGVIQVTRARGAFTYPADFQLIAAMNPCPCGFAQDPNQPCHCTTDTIRRYQSKLSGPVLDRIDLHVPLERQKSSLLLTGVNPSSPNTLTRDRIQQLRDLQFRRQGSLNAKLAGADLMAACGISKSTTRWLGDTADQLMLSARAIHKVLRVARTLADLRNSVPVEEADLLEALGYRLRQHPASRS